MTTHKKGENDPDNDQFDDESIHDEVSRVFKDHAKDYFSKLEEIGFEYQDDDENDQDEQEEAAAKPLNSNQKQLFFYFNGETLLSDHTIEIFLEERRRPKPNYPLFRKYFKTGNKRLLQMLLLGLQLYPTSDELLYDLCFFHENHAILQIVIDKYMTACERQENLESFSELVQDFYYATAPDGYDAFYTLQEKFPIDTNKRKVIDFLIEIQKTEVDKKI